MRCPHPRCRAQDGASLRRALSGESNALDLDAVAVAELQGAGGTGRRVGREELAPNPVQLVVIPAIGKHDGYLYDAVETGSGGFEHVPDVMQRLADLLGNRAEIAPPGDRVYRPHSRQEDVIADPNARRVRQVGVARNVELRVLRLDHNTGKKIGHRSEPIAQAKATHSISTLWPPISPAPHTVRAGGSVGKNSR